MKVYLKICSAFCCIFNIIVFPLSASFKKKTDSYVCVKKIDMDNFMHILHDKFTIL